MRMGKLIWCACLVTVAWNGRATSRADEPAANLPPAVIRDVDFHKDVFAILTNSCVKCHSGNKPKGGLRLETRDTLLAGGESGAVVVAGKSGDSLLIQLVAGADEKRLMPAQGPRLSKDQIGVLRAWIDQGLKWPDGFKLRGVQQAPLEPRRPDLPLAQAGSNLSNPIDLWLQSYWHEQGLQPVEPVADATFARRVSLDLVGLLPSPEVLAAFAGDARPDKRQRLVRKLLDDRRAYAEHWLTFWNDALRNAYRGTGFIDGGRKPISEWLYQSLYNNQPYDRFVHELISPVSGSEGFINGITWRGVVNASQRREMQAAQNVAQVLLGTNLKCASCHDSFINHWKLADSYALAAVFADGALEIHRCDKPTGQHAAVGFIYPQLGSLDAKADRAARMKQLADLLTQPHNGRLTRTIVNRLWALLLGRGIIEPLDDLDQPAWQQDLLDWLAADLQDHGYDLKRTLELICSSRAYQQPAVGAPRPDDKEFVFRGPIVRRMTAEQFVDAIAALTGVWPQQAATPLPAVEAGAKELKIEAQWIWNHAQAAQADPGGRIFVRKSFALKNKPKSAVAVVTCDNEFTFYVNGRKLAAGKTWSEPTAVDLNGVLVAGQNVIAVEAINWPDRETQKGLDVTAANPAGLFFSAAIQNEQGEWLTVGSDSSSLWSNKASAAWHELEFETAGWQHTVELGNLNTAPWNSGGKLAAVLLQKTRVPGSGGAIGVRTALVNDDLLTRALGRPNREQVVTRRDSIATTLQAIELTNGQTLDSSLKAGAARWVANHRGTPTELAEQIYRKGLGRRPNAAESRAAVELLGDNVTAAAVEDLLWIVTMLPEFQLIY